MALNRQYTVQVNSTQEMVYRTLRDEILMMELKPGTVITTQDTATRLDVSRTPVREAFLRLQRENLLEISPQKATMVTLIDLKRVYQEMFIRKALEIENLKEFISVATETTILTMQLNVAQQVDAMNEKRYEDYVELDNQFHQIAFNETEEFLGLDLVRRMNGHYDRIRLLTAWKESIALNAIEEHKRFIRYVKEKDLEKAQGLMRTHLENLWLVERVLTDKWSDYFKKE